MDVNNQEIVVDPLVLEIINREIDEDKRKIIKEKLINFPNQEGLLNVFFFLREYSSSERFDEALEVLDKYWESDFKYQHPDARGSFSLGWATKQIFWAMDPASNMDLALILPDLLGGEYEVQTDNSIYRLHPKLEDGTRRLICISRGIDVTGRITSIYPNEPMFFVWDGKNPKTGRIKTSCIKKIILIQPAQ